MKPWELYDWQKNLDYNTNVLDYDWKVEVDDEEKKIYAVSQFSTSTLDWIVNFLFFFTPQIRRWNIYFACLGWQSTFNACKEIFMTAVINKMIEHPDYDVVAVGHSYGGAGSVLAGIEIFFRTGIKPDLLTWGAPKPLVFIFSKLVSRLFFRNVVQYAHKSDIVTYMPPLLGYWNIKVVRIGNFSFRELFNPHTHDSYGDPELYKDIDC